MNGSGRRRVDRGDGGPSRVDTDTALRLLSDPLCRFVIRQLVEVSGTGMALDELVGRYVERSRGAGRESVELQCRHAHLPALETAGVVEFDPDSGDVRYHSDPFIEELLDVIERWEA